MLRYKRPKVRVSLANTRIPRYQIHQGDEGWILYDDLAELAGYNELVSSMIEEGTYLEFGNKAVTEAIAINRQFLKGIMLRPIIGPYLGEGSLEDISVLEPADTSSTQESEDGMFTEFLQEASTDIAGEPISSSWTFDQNCCPNVFFAIGIQRQAPTKEMLQDLEASDYTDAEWTNILFGGGEWCLHLPLKGEPTLWQFAGNVLRPEGYMAYWPESWVYRPWTEGQLQSLEARGMADSGVHYRIGGLGNAVCVSEGDFTDNFAYYIAADKTVAIPSGDIQVTNWPGQSVVRFSPCFFHTATLFRTAVQLPAIRVSDISYHIWAHIVGGPVNGGGVNGIIDELEDYPHYLVYTLEIEPYTYPQVITALPPGGQWTYTTPFVEAIHLCQEPDLTDNGEPAFTEIDRDTYSLSANAELEGGRSEMHQVTVDNRLATDAVAGLAGTIPTAEWTAGRELKIEAGWIYDSDGTDEELTTQLGRYYILDPTRTSTEGTFTVADLLARVSLLHWDEGDLCLRGWNAATAIRFLLRLKGIGPDWYEIEDTGATLPIQLGETDQGWTWPAGTPLLDIIQDIAGTAARNATVWYDGQQHKIKTGCRYCRTVRTPANWYSHQDNGWFSSGCPSAVGITIVASEDDAGDPSSLNVSQDLAGRVEIINQQQYANRITVIGRARDGRAITARWEDGRTLYDTDSPYFIGWPITKVIEDGNLQTQDDVNRRLVEVSHELSAWPSIAEVRIPLHTSIRPGGVIQIDGGKAMGFHEEKFRVQSVTHQPEQAETRLVCRMLYGTDVDVSSQSSSSSSSASQMGFE